MLALLHIGKSITSGNIWVECFAPSLGVPGELYISSCCVNSSSSVHVSGRTCHPSIQISYSCHALETSCFPTVLDMFEDFLHQCPMVKDLIRDCFGRLGAKESAITAFNLLLLRTYIAQTRVTFLSLLGGH